MVWGPKGFRLRLRSLSTGEWHDIETNEKQMLLFDGGVYHYGLGYPEPNLRFHFKLALWSGGGCGEFVKKVHALLASAAFVHETSRYRTTHHVTLTRHLSGPRIRDPNCK